MDAEAAVEEDGDGADLDARERANERAATRLYYFVAEPGSGPEERDAAVGEQAGDREIRKAGEMALTQDSTLCSVVLGLSMKLL